MTKINLREWPFGRLVLLSLVLSMVHGLLQFRWTALRYSSFGTRPIAAQAFIALEVLLLMVISTVGMIHISNEERTEPKGRYYLGIAASVGAWIVVSFVI